MTNIVSTTKLLSMNKTKQFLFLFALLVSGLVQAQNEFPNTLSYNDSIGSPPANIAAVSWLAGHWRGEAFGGITEEVWSPPLAGSMMGAFKLVINGQVSFYELETIIEENSTLILKLKHFNNDLTGWEEKDDTIDFRLVKMTDNKVYFEGFTLERISDNEINMFVVTEDGEQQSEVKFNYKRVEN